MSHPPVPAQTHHLTIEQTTTALSIELCVHGSTGPMNRPIPPLALMIHTMLALRRMCLVGRPFSRTVMRVQTFDGRDGLPKEEDKISRRSREAEVQNAIPMRFFCVRQNAAPFKTTYCRSIHYHGPTDSISFISNEGLLLFWRRKAATKNDEGQPSSSASSEVCCDSSVVGDGTGAIIVDGPTDTSSSYQLITASYPSTLRIFDIIEPELGKQPSLVEATEIDMDAAFNCRSLFHICPRPWDHRRVILGHSSGIALFDLDSQKIVKSNTRFGVRVMGMCIVDSSSSSSSSTAAARFVACCANGSLFFWSADFDEDIAIQKAPFQGEHMDIVALPRSMRCPSASQSLNLLAVSNSSSGIRIIECPTLSTARSAKNKNESMTMIVKLPAIVVPLREISVGILPLCILPWDLVEDWLEDEPLC